MNRKIKITFEIEEVTFFKTRKVLFAFCEHCNLRVEILTAENAALFLNRSEIQIFQLIEIGHVHFIEADEVYLCRNSLELWTEKYSKKQFTQNGEIKKLKD